MIGSYAQLIRSILERSFEVPTGTGMSQSSATLSSPVEAETCLAVASVIANEEHSEVVSSVLVP